MAYLPPLNGGRVNLSITGNTTGTLTLVSSGTMMLAGGNNVTLSQAGNTVSINGPTPTTISRWEYPNQVFTSLGVAGQGSLSIQHMYVPFNVTGTAMKIGGSLNIQTSTNGSLRTGSMSLWMGVYTLSGSTLSLASSGSTLNTLGYNAATTGSTANSSVTGMRQATVPININMSAGEYWVGAVMSTSTVGQSFNYTMYGNNQVAGAASNAILAPIGSNITAARDVMLFQGMYTAATAGLPGTIQGSQINNSSASYVQSANFYNAIYNATY